MQRILGRVLVAGCVWVALHFPSVSLADTASPSLVQAQTALMSRDFGQALQLGSGPLAQTHPFDAAMIRARASLELGRPQQALHAAKEAQLAKPNDSAAFALEGMARLALGQNTQGMFALRRALDFAQTPTEKNIARALIRQAKAQKKWHWAGGVGIAPSSNINKATKTETFLFFDGSGVRELELDDGQAVSGTGLSVFGGVTRHVAVTPKSQLTFKAGLSGKFYKDSEWSNQSAQASVAWTLRPGQHSQVTAKLSYNGSQFDGDPFAETRGIEIAGQRNLPAPDRGPRFVSYTLGYDDQLRHDIADNANITKRGRLAYTWTPTPHQQWSVGLRFSDRASPSNAVAAQHGGFDLGVRVLPKQSAWQLSFGGMIQKGDWARQTSYEHLIRADRDLSIWMSAQNNNTSFLGMTPTYGVSYLRRKSNLERHDITSHDVFLGLANAF